MSINLTPSPTELELDISLVDQQKVKNNIERFLSLHTREGAVAKQQNMVVRPPIEKEPDTPDNKNR